MDGWRLLTSGAILAAAFGIFYFGSLPREYVGSASPRNLVIGVLSARDHFLQRDAIRRTWGSSVSSLPNTELVFMVGEYDCPIHPEDRISPETCDRWHIEEKSVEEFGRKSFFKVKQMLKRSDGSHFECHSGIGFQILHPILLEGFRVSIKFLSRIGNCSVILQDAEEVLESLEIAEKSCSEENSESGYCEIKLQYPLLLPKLFEGEVKIQTIGSSEVEFCGQDFFSLQAKEKQDCEWTNSSVIKYKYLRSKNDVLTKWSGNSCPLLSASYSVADRDVLKKHIENEPIRNSEWKDHLDFVLRKITIEQVLNRDLIILPLLDIYSKLPEKVMAFLQRLTLEFDFIYMMKVDDDTFVNISSLKTLMNSGGSNLPKMWSRFNHHRAVPVYGKWADVKYPSLTYPSFPAGAGYLMSGSLAQRLVAAGPYMTTYGGEDVSVGIWVSSAVEDAILVDVPCWLPRSECQETVLISQLSPIDMMEMWKKYV